MLVKVQNTSFDLYIIFIHETILLKNRLSTKLNSYEFK